ncbi:Fanconi-associated nuclease 1 [Mactra antiquata]
MSSKRGKLSLKKKIPTGKQSASTGNTIVSMFKNQEKRQNDINVVDSNLSESKDDIQITKVSGFGQSESQPTVGNQSPKHEQKSTLSKSKLSLSDKKKQKHETDNSDTSNVDEEDEGSKHLYSKQSRKNISKSKSMPDGIKASKGSRYTLRKRSTVPIVEISDSDDDFKVETTDRRSSDKLQRLSLKLKQRSKQSKDTEGNSRLNNLGKVTARCSASSEDSDSLIIEEPGIDKSKYFKSDGKRKLSSKSGDGRLSLKKMKKSDEDLVIVSDDQKQSVTGDILLSEEKSNKKINSEGTTEALPHVKKSSKESHDQNLHRTDSSLSQRSELNDQGTKKNILSYFGATNKGKSRDSTKTHQNKTKDQPVMIKTSYGSEVKSYSNESEAKPIDNDVDIDEDTSQQAKDNGSDTKLPAMTDNVEFRVPYYLENFLMIINTMLEDKENIKLFDETDLMFVNKFYNLEEASQKLYVRLFSRKLKWLPVTKVIYPEISDDIPYLLDDLIAAGLLLSGEDLHDLTIVLKILSAPDLKLLAKSFHINGTNLTKMTIIEQLLKKSQQNSISALFKGGNKNTMEKTILSRAKSYLGKACRLHDEPRAVFIRLLMLFSLYSTNFDEDSGGGGQNQLFQMLMVNIGRVVYPSYVVNRQRSVFQDRSALVRFETALQFEMEIQNKMDQGKWKDAYELYTEARDVGKEVCHDKQYVRWDEKLPQYLRFYTAGSVYTRIDSHGVEILQRLKLYKDAVCLLEELLKQDLYCEHYRGHWYERLALNLEAHLKSIDKSFAVLKKGLSDVTVRTGRRLALYERARKICEAPKSKYADRMSEFNHDEVRPTPEVQIEGMVMSDATSMGMKYQFIMQGNTDSVTLCAVEELVLEHYKQNGYPEGLHAEGSVISNLFVLLFWDIMYMDIPDVFHGPFQSCPLDMATRDFYINRQQCIDNRLQWIKNSSIDDLKCEIGRIWEENNGKMCFGINWDKFTSPETHQNLVSCMGGEVITGILDRYVKDPRHTRSGFPDLTLWKSETKQLKICEVKGPNDRLSYKQILWIDYLLKLGVDAEVCYVKAVGSKKLKPIENK